jgi:hypothetical protein
MVTVLRTGTVLSGSSGRRAGLAGSGAGPGREEEWRFTPLRRLRGLLPWGPNKITEDGRGQLRALGFNV